MPGTRIGLDSPVFAGRIRTAARSNYVRRSVHTPVRSRMISDMWPAAQMPNQAKPVMSAAAKPKAGVSTSAKRRRTSSASPFLPHQSRSKVLRRAGVKKQITKRRSSRKLSFKSGLLTLMATGLFIVGVGIGVSTLRTNQHVAAQVKKIAAQEESAPQDSTQAVDPVVPSEAPATAPLSGYQVAPTLPRVIRIAKIGVEARVLRMGVKANNELRAPNSIFDAGWYEGSSKPGEAGAMLIDGHLSGPTQSGVFYKLKKLVKGDTITIERGDGKTFTYAVVTSKTYPANGVDMAAALTSASEGKPGLNIITCAGEVDDTGHSFKDRTVVFAVQQ